MVHWVTLYLMFLLKILIVSIICTVVMVLLFLAEFGEFITIDTKSEMMVDIRHHDDRLNINIDIVFPKMPCEILNLDV